MKVLLDIKDSKASSLMDVLKGLSYVKVKVISDEKAQLMEETRGGSCSQENLKLVRQGKPKLVTPRESVSDEL